MRRTCSHEARECCPSPGQQTFSLSVLEPCTHPRALPEKAGKYTTLCTQQWQFLAHDYPKSTQNTVQPSYGGETSESSSASSRNSGPRIFTYTLDFHLTTPISSTPPPSNHAKRNSRGEKNFEKGGRNPLAYFPNSYIPALSSQVCADHELRFTAPEQLHLSQPQNNYT